MLKFSTENLRRVFADEDKYKNFRKLCYDLNHDNEIYEYDDEGNQVKISKHEANRAIRKIFLEVLGLDEEDLKSKKRRHRAIETHHNEIFELIESDIDFKVETAFKESEWFNDFVDMRNVALGDSEEYWITENVMLIISEISGNHHDLNYSRVCIA